VGEAGAGRLRTGPSVGPPCQGLGAGHAR
jgi:hypothetical protein